jgi:hypothetical protein
VTVASAAIAMCGCDGIVVVQRMVAAMKWRCSPGTPPYTGIGTCMSVPGIIACVGVVAAAWVDAVCCAGDGCRCGCRDHAGVSVCHCVCSSSCHRGTISMVRVVDVVACVEECRGRDMDEAAVCH